MVVDDCVVVNLSIVRLMTDQLDLLALSPKYCPTPCSLDCQRLSHDITEECHRIHLKELYHDPDKDIDLLCTTIRERQSSRRLL